MNNQKLGLNYVFVYGTLKRGQHNHHLLSNAIFLGDATVKGVMIHLGYFPALIPQKTEGDSRVVHGEVFLVDNKTLGQLDRLESEGEMYLRKSTIAQAADNGNNQAVWVYYWGTDLNGENIIHSGVWA